MNAQQKELITATVPLLRTSGQILTNHFYRRMFAHHPELKETFNMGNQANGRQKSALANAVLAYAENIENPGVLLDVLKGIGNKHVSLNIKPEQYVIVGTHLLASISEVLGDVATPEILDAWKAAFFELADIMAGLEKEMYKENQSKPGGWIGWRKFVVRKITEESAEIKSFYLYPEDGNAIAGFSAGQFLSVQVFVDNLGLLQPRQYSLSDSFNGEYYRISVKREANTKTNPEGMVSNQLHTVKTGDVINVSAPMGLFKLKENTGHPVVLISGGVGLTPMLSMLQTVKNSQEKPKTVWVHGCRNEAVHAFKDEVAQLNRESHWLESLVFYDAAHNGTGNVISGRVDLHAHKDAVLLENANYYICGPEQFIRAQYQSLTALNVHRDNIFYEEFGPQLIGLN